MREVDADQATIMRKPVDRRANPSLGGAWGSSVQRDRQSKAYRHRLMTSEATADNYPAPGDYKPFDHPEEEFQVGTRSSSSGWRKTGLQPGPVGREAYEQSTDESTKPQTSTGELPMLRSKPQPCKHPDAKRRPAPRSAASDSLPSFAADWEMNTPRAQEAGEEAPAAPPESAQ